MSTEFRTFYESVTWEEPSPREKERLLSIVQRVPGDADSILEIGCGDGRLSNELPARQLVFADLSFSALRQFRRPNSNRVQASGNLLPFQDHSFDFVLCSEVLEHLSDDVLGNTLAEIQRLAHRYVLLTVPFREDLREESRQCPKCGKVFHVYGHLRNFTESALKKLLPAFRPIHEWKLGPEAVWLKSLLWLRKPPAGGTCLYCGYSSKPARPVFSQKLLTWFHTNYVAPWHRKPYWIGILYQRKL
jgi:SAM-dependent methyltransferase